MNSSSIINYQIEYKATEQEMSMMQIGRRAHAKP
jgi:hypothetical protein